MSMHKRYCVKIIKNLFSKLLLLLLVFVSSNLGLKITNACKISPSRACFDGLQGNNDNSMKFDKVKIKIYKNNERGQRHHRNERERVHRHNRRHNRRHSHRHGRKHRARRHFF